MLKAENKISFNMNVQSVPLCLSTKPKNPSNNVNFYKSNEIKESYRNEKMIKNNFHRAVHKHLERKKLSLEDNRKKKLSKAIDADSSNEISLCKVARTSKMSPSIDREDPAKNFAELPTSYVNGKGELSIISKLITIS